jgi:hypothetical protein
MDSKPGSRFAETDPRHHTENLKCRLEEIIQHAREDVGKIDEPQAKAIFEMTAEVLTGVKKTLADYEEKRERAFAPPATPPGSGRAPPPGRDR